MNPRGEQARFDFDADLPVLADLRRVHFVAIGGSGMSGVAALYVGAGCQVSGSDTAENAAVTELRARGAHVFHGHDASQVGHADAVVVSGAVPEDNAELRSARERAIPVLHRAQAIAVLSRARDAVAVAGTNGKTTTSAMLTGILFSAGLDPGFVVGSPLVDRGSSAALGSGPMVVEADESDRSFVAYRPRVAVVTNVTADHLDFYGDFDGVQRGYADFVDTITPAGMLVSNADDPGSQALASHARARGLGVVTWGQSDQADMRIEAITADLHRSVAQVTWQSDVGSVTAGHRHRLRVPVPGEHNIQNAAAALVAAVAGYAVDVDQGVRALDDFAGTRRRFELVGHAGGVEVVDDYAHNGPKVAAVVRAGRAVAGDGRRLVVVFQPHMYSRTAAFAADFADGLSPADVVVVLDVYGARESPVPGVSGETVVSALRARGGRTPELHYVAARDEAVDRISALLRAGDLVLTVGAGDVTSVGPELLRRRGHERG